jgi:sulfur-carrier protein
MSEPAAVKVQVPGMLRGYCGGARELPVSGASVRAVLEEIERRHPSLYGCICDETGAVRRHVNVFINTANIRDEQGLDSALANGDVVTILPAVSGG